jgi:D-xylose transport system substrate-binding protein
MKLKTLALLGAATAVATMSATSAFAQTVGVSWANFQEERWTGDKAVLEATLSAAGINMIDADAQSSVEKQNADIENLITRGIDYLIVVAADTEAVIPAVQAALDEGIPVMGYDRLIELEGVAYTSFDNVEVGRIQARVVFASQPTGNYVFIKGNPADPNAHFVHGGQLEILQAAIDSGDIKIVGDQFTDGWVPGTAQSNMENILTAADNNVDAVVVSNDGMAGGVVAALTAVGLEGIPVSGQDGDFAALNRVAKGTQSVSVWKDVRALASTSAEWAAHIIGGGDAASFEGVATFTTPAKELGVDSVLLAPTPITQDNLSVVVDAGHIPQDVLCEGVSGGPAPCN